MGVAIPLTKGKVAIVDEADAEMLSRYRWCYLNVGYAARHERIDGKDRTILMHRFLLGASPEQLVDHINGNGLDNRRENIRLCTKADNQRNQRRNSKNTTGYKGVSFDKARGKYIASIQVLGTQIHLGRFSTAEEASKAYEEAASRYHGEFAYAHSASYVPAVPSDGQRFRLGIVGCLGRSSVVPGLQASGWRVDKSTLEYSLPSRMQQEPTTPPLSSTTATRPS